MIFVGGEEEEEEEQKEERRERETQIFIYFSFLFILSLYRNSIISEYTAKNKKIKTRIRSQ